MMITLLQGMLQASSWRAALLSHLSLAKLPLSRGETFSENNGGKSLAIEAQTSSIGPSSTPSEGLMENRLPKGTFLTRLHLTSPLTTQKTTRGRRGSLKKILISIGSGGWPWVRDRSRLHSAMDRWDNLGPMVITRESKKKRLLGLPRVRSPISRRRL